MVYYLIRGKLLNVRDKTAKMVAGNKIICNIIQALGLKHGVNYKKTDNYEKLNYGRLVIVADADCDGIHIEGLLLNFIHCLYPSLLQRKVPFVVSMKTPIARIGSFWKLNRGEKCFMIQNIKRFHQLF